MSRKLNLVLSDFKEKRITRDQIYTLENLRGLLDLFFNQNKKIDLVGQSNILPVFIDAEGSKIDISDAEATRAEVLQFFNDVIGVLTDGKAEEHNLLLFPDAETEDISQPVEKFTEYLQGEIKFLEQQEEKEGSTEAQTEKEPTEKKSKDDDKKAATVAGGLLGRTAGSTPDSSQQTSGESPQPTSTAPTPQTQSTSPDEELTFSRQNFHLNQEILRETISLENYLISAFELDKTLNLNSFPPELRELVRTQVTVTFNKLNLSEYIGDDGKINITKLRFAIFKKALTQLQQNPIFLAELQLLDERKLQESTTDPSAKTDDNQHRQKVVTLISDANISKHVEKDVSEEESGGKFAKLKDQDFKKQMYQLVVFEELKSPKILDQMVASAIKNKSDLQKFPDLSFDLEQLLPHDLYEKFIILSPPDQQKILSALDFRLQNPLSLPEKIRNQLSRNNRLSERELNQLHQSLDLEKLKNVVVSSWSLGSIFDVAGNKKLENYLQNLSEDAKRQLVRHLQDLQAYQTNLREQKLEQKKLAEQYNKYQKEKSSILRQALKEHGIEGAKAEEVIRFCQDIAFSRTGAEQIADYFSELLDYIDPQISQNQELMSAITGYSEAIKYEVRAQNHFALTQEDVSKDEALEEATAYHRLTPEERVVAESAPSVDNDGQPFSESFTPNQEGGGLINNYRGWKGRVGGLNKLRKKFTKDRLKQLGLQVATKLAPLAGVGLGAAGLIHTITQAVGALQGAGLGALSGALTGAAVGSFFPVIGTGVGAFVGGALGGIGGFLAGGARAGGSGLDFLTGAENASNAAKSLVKDVGSVVRNTAVQTTNAAGKIMAGSYTSTLPVGGIIIGTTTGILALSVYSMMTIYSAFLPDADSSFVGYQSGEYSRYLDITKVASPSKLENGQTATVSYTITFTPKLDAQITLSSLTDDVTDLPTGQPFIYNEKQSQDGAQQIADALVNKPFTEPQTFSYSVDGVSGEDVLLTNKISANFIAKVEEQEYNEDLSGVASVRIGNPKVGCFEFAGGGYNFLGNNTINWKPEEEDRITRSFLKRAGTNNTYLTYLCEKGNIKIYRLPDSSSNQWHGWAPGSLNGTAFALYSRAFSHSDNSLEYTLVHELGHIIDYRNAGLRSKFLLTRRSTSCFTYPFTCSEYEAFAEGVVLSVVYSTYNFSSGLYNFPQINPVEYNWFKDNIFGGLECDANSCTN